MQIVQSGSPGSVSFYQHRVTVNYAVLGYDSRGAPMTTTRSDLGMPEIDDDGVLHYFKRVLLLRSPWKIIQAS